ncbi:MAG: 16S rRNA (cytosine(1402)-N(4))-methyltransferase, partial [Malacoplasma sp.]|nr:16S rRNA (cytosine(1402)-N(4))-methyltransferase [Malacoplasma sp.]
FKHKHPARIYFQAIRMEVNHELEVLTSFINEVVKYLKVNGIIAIITFHSLEDRIVKTIFNKLTISSLPKEIPIQQDPNVKFALVNKKPIVPTEQEIDENKRSHSAKLRALKRIKE